METKKWTEMKLAVLTSGGDSPGMNAAVRAIVRMGIFHNHQVYAIFEGYEGLVKGGQFIKEMTWNDVAQIISIGGTVIGSARSKEFREEGGRKKSVQNLIQLGIHSLVVIGGDGSLTGADVLRQEWKSHLESLVKEGIISKETARIHSFLSIVGLLGSIDNDMVGTEWTIGADSSLHRIIECIDVISTSAASHQRIFIIEVMGRHCGWLALMAAVACGADWLFLPERPSIANSWQDAMCTTIKKSRNLGKRSSIIILSEGAVDTECQPVTSQMVKDVIGETLNLESRITVLGHVQRGGSPSAFDRILASLQGEKAVQVLSDAEKSGGCSVMIGIQENKICCLPLTECVARTRSVESAMSERRFSDAFALRDPDFRDIFEMVWSVKSKIDSVSIPGFPSKRIAIICVGAPAGGMNAALHTFVRYSLIMGYEPIAMNGGWEGVLSSDSDADNMTSISWTDVDGWTSTGGCHIGVRRGVVSDPLLAFDILKRHNIKGLVILGGYDAFLSARILHSYRQKFPHFGTSIPIVCIPATVSNNVPGIEYSIGCDTALNVITSCCDIIRQSASSTKRVFVVETHGGKCGFLTQMGGLASGATCTYIPEEGVHLSDICRDAKHLRVRFQEDKSQGRLVLVNEGMSSTYSADVMAHIFEEEGKHLFDARTCKLGHLQQGGSPSPRDRILATRLAKMSVDFIETNMNQCDNPAACVVGIRNGEVRFSSVADLQKEADDVNRVWRNPWWLSYRPIAQALAKQSHSHPSESIAVFD